MGRINWNEVTRPQLKAADTIVKAMNRLYGDLLEYFTAQACKGLTQQDLVKVAKIVCINYKKRDTKRLCRVLETIHSIKDTAQ